MDKKKTLEKIVDLGAFAGSLLASWGILGDNGLDNIGVTFSLYNAYDELKKCTPLYTGDDKPSFRNYAKRTLMAWGVVKLVDYIV
jgi:hypothetical protein